MNYNETKTLFDSIYEEELLFIKQSLSIDKSGYVSKTYDFLGENHYNAGKLAIHIPMIESRIVLAIEEILKKKICYIRKVYTFLA